MSAKQAIVKGLFICGICAISFSVEAQDTVLQKIFIETGSGFADLPKTLVQVGDPTVVKIPNAEGHATFCAAGIQMRRWIRLKFEWEKETVAGTGSFAQSSSDPNQSGGAVGKFGIDTNSKMFAAEFDPWAKRRFHPFAGLGIGRTTIHDHFLGKSDPVRYYDPRTNTTITIVQPVVDQGTENIWDGTGRVGVRYRVRKGLEADLGAYGKDSINVKVGIALFPGALFSRTSQ